MTPDIVSRWLALVARTHDTVKVAEEVEQSLVLYDEKVAGNDPRAHEPGLREAIEAARHHIEHGGSARDIQERLDVLLQARLFSFSQAVVAAATQRGPDMVGSPDLEELPFPVCWFDIQQTYKDMPLHGYIITRGGLLGAVYTAKTGEIDVAFLHACNDEGWDPVSLEPAWVLWLLAQLVAGHVSERTPLGGFGLRRALARLREKGVRTPPPELYVLNLDRRRAGHALGKIIEARQGPSYRYEVRRHERMLIRRGRWPADEETAEEFKSKGYTVERGDSLTEKAGIGLELRGLPAGTRNEWVAWKFIPVREHEAGPQGMPTRRALRVSAAPELRVLDTPG